MRQLRRLAAGLLALAVLAGCTTEVAAPADRIRGVAAAAAVSQVNRVDIDANQVWLYYLEGDQQMTATQFKDDEVSSQPDTAPEGYLPQRPIDELGLDAFNERLAAVKDSCTDGKFGGRIYPTVGGALVQHIGCGNWVFSKVYLDSQEVAPLTEWDEATLDRVLGEARAVHGATTRDLVFSTPKTGGINPAYNLNFVSADQTGTDGQPCRIGSWRYAESGENSPMLNYGTCSSSLASLSDQEFTIDDVTGKKILAAMASGAQKMGIAAQDIGDFTVLFSDGQLKLQMKAGKGIPAKAPIVSEPIV